MLKLKPNLPLWLGSSASSGPCRSRFCLHRIFHLIWSCPQKNPRRPCTSVLTSRSTDSAPVFSCDDHKENQRKMWELAHVSDVGVKTFKRNCAQGGYWLREAVGGSDDPARWHQWTSTRMLASILQADLPGPMLDDSICAPNNTVLRAPLSTVW